MTECATSTKKENVNKSPQTTRFHPIQTRWELSKQIRFFVTVLSLCFFLAACGEFIFITLPKLEIQPETWILYENMAIHDTDRTGNWRFRIGDDGCLYHARNSQLWVDAVQSTNSAPELHWNTPLPDNAVRCLTQEQKDELTAVLDKINLAAIAPYYPTPAGDEYSHQTAERWTIKHGGKTYMIVVENENAPEALVQLRQTLDELVANALRVTTP